MKVGKIELLLLALGFVGMAAFIIIFHNKPLFQDEVPYLYNVTILHRYGLGKEYLLNLLGSAGPLHSLVHYCFEPLTHLQPTGVRLVNLAFLGGTIYFTGLILQASKIGQRSYSLYVMCIPKVYIFGAMAITDMPAIFFLSMSVFFLFKVVDSYEDPGKAFFYSLVCGLCMCLAIIGRQPILPALFAFPLLFLKKLNLRSFLYLGTIFVVALAVPCYMFLLWNGLMPPGDQIYYQAPSPGIHLTPQYFMFSLFYHGFIFAIISPAIFVIPRKTALLFILVCIVAGVIIYAVKEVSYLPLEHVMKKILPAGLLEPAGYFLGTMMVIIGAYVFLTLLWQAKQHIHNHVLLFFIFASLFICASCLKITWGFFSRYAFQGIPVLIPITAFFYRHHRFHVLFVVIAVIAGLLSTYVQFVNG